MLENGRCDGCVCGVVASLSVVALGTVPINDRIESHRPRASRGTERMPSNMAYASEETKAKLDESNKAVTFIKGKCDICRKKDGYQDHNLQRCKDCGINVHDLCYGLVATDSKNPDFLCYACNAVGTVIEVNNPSRIGSISKKNKREFVTQETRPTQCVLCSFDDGSFHAMHPIMDMGGKDGRQLVLPETKTGAKRLAWAHTLCASFICSTPMTRGCVFGLDENNEWNNYEDDDRNEEENDSVEEGQYDVRSSKQDTTHPRDADAGNSIDQDVPVRPETPVQESIRLGSVTAYGIADESWDMWYTRIRKNRTYKCFICGKDDKKSLRIPIQCIVDEDGENEYFEFKEWRKNCPNQYSESEFLEQRGVNCTVVMHVGCARWNANLETVVGKISHLVYFYPGKQSGDCHLKFDMPVANCYCPAHARELIMGNPKNAHKVDSIVKLQSNVGKQSFKKRESEPPPRKGGSEPKQARTNCQYEKAKGNPSNKKVSPMKRSPMPFGKKKSGVASRATKEVDFIALGKTGKAVSRRLADKTGRNA